jgi:hypothetical protein
MRDVKREFKFFLQPAFLICVVVLAIAAAVSGKLSVVKKEFLPLKKSFDALNEARLAPYKVVKKLKIENKDIVEALGTQDYIQWVLEDMNAKHGSSVKKCMLFITYYGRPDRVPHVPEECYTGGGFQILAKDDVMFYIKDAGFERKVEGQYRVFSSGKADLRQRLEKFPVLYFFNVNGKYAGSRGKARFVLNKNLFHKFSYFSKVELVFNQALVAPSKEDAVAAAEKLLTVILPILEQEHWPSW